MNTGCTSYSAVIGVLPFPGTRATTGNQNFLSGLTSTENVVKYGRVGCNDGNLV